MLPKKPAATCHIHVQCVYWDMFILLPSNSIMGRLNGFEKVKTWTRNSLQMAQMGAGL